MTVHSGSKESSSRLLGAPEELAGEERLPGVLGDDLHVEAVALVGPGVGVHDEDLLEVLHVARRPSRAASRTASEEKGLLTAPQSTASRVRLVLDDKAVLGTAARAFARADDQSAPEGSLIMPSRRRTRGLHEARRRQILVHRAEVAPRRSAPATHLAYREVHVFPFARLMPGGQPPITGAAGAFGGRNSSKGRGPPPRFLAPGAG